MLFENHQDGGKRMCPFLEKYRNQNAVVLALPGGGVVVAAEIAKFFHAPFDILLAHKIGHPYQAENAVPALYEKGYLVVSSHERLSLNESWLESKDPVRRHAKEKGKVFEGKKRSFCKR